MKPQKLGLSAGFGLLVLVFNDGRRNDNRGGDANNDETVSVGDLSCVGGAFGGAPTVCSTLGYPPGTSDVNADGTVNIFDLVLVGGNYNKVSPQPWQ